jgi:hypothetical protein
MAAPGLLPLTRNGKGSPRCLSGGLETLQKFRRMPDQAESGEPKKGLPEYFSPHAAAAFGFCVPDRLEGKARAPRQVPGRGGRSLQPRAGRRKAAWREATARGPRIRFRGAHARPEDGETVFAGPFKGLKIFPLRGALRR